MTDAVVVERVDGVAVLRLCEPENRNALSAAIKERLQALVPALVDDPGVRCLLITGEGSAFCAGGDVRSLVERQSPAEVRARLARSYAWIAKLLNGETPVVTAVNGAAVGAGFGLAMLGDVVLASDAAWFMAGFGLIGAVADYGLARTLPRAVGALRAKDILLTGRRVDAAEAERIGLVSRIIPADRLHEEAMTAARAIAAGPSVALGLTKSLIGRAYEGGAEDFLRAEGYAQAMAFGTADHAEGVDAFLAKRRPTFEGR
ncbi:enoyl-CoA hydratase/isomerase family protein [Sphingosinicella terrae]|uniref:enoyl-CoA hydratase/isomerase family protein n=1 Tax=Sphingosinicella terrae TaxID=2172047 RepID=UPI000E0DC130|nr:enoyl-CoA hydratase-related protein [Sphingosinicella terrae]